MINYRLSIIIEHEYVRSNAPIDARNLRQSSIDDDVSGKRSRRVLRRHEPKRVFEPDESRRCPKRNERFLVSPLPRVWRQFPMVTRVGGSRTTTDVVRSREWCDPLVFATVELHAFSEPVEESQRPRRFYATFAILDDRGIILRIAIGRYNKTEVELDETKVGGVTRSFFQREQHRPAPREEESLTVVGVGSQPRPKTSLEVAWGTAVMELQSWLLYHLVAVTDCNQVALI